MDITMYLLTGFLSGMTGIFWLLIGFLLFNALTPKWNFEDVFKEKGFSGGALVVSSFLLGLALIISKAVF